MLRHVSRHVHGTVLNHVTAGLTALDWLTPGNVPFGEAPLTVRPTRAFVGGKLDPALQPGTVAVSLGNEAPTDLLELGGPLSQQEYPFFFDVFADTEAVALAIAGDIRDLLMGRVSGFAPGIPLVNQIDTTVEPGWRLMFDDIERVGPDHAFPLHWQVVHATAVATFQEVVW